MRSRFSRTSLSSRRVGLDIRFRTRDNDVAAVGGVNCQVLRSILRVQTALVGAHPLQSVDKLGIALGDVRKKWGRCKFTKGTGLFDVTITVPGRALDDLVVCHRAGDRIGDRNHGRADGAGLGRYEDDILWADVEVGALGCKVAKMTAVEVVLELYVRGIRDIVDENAAHALQTYNDHRATQAQSPISPLGIRKFGRASG
eukprot:scaffold880_cov384-Prasinococcus_capsulatus_cf.AAC.9